jgi:hypothetical protein
MKKNEDGFYKCPFCGKYPAYTAPIFIGEIQKGRFCFMHSCDERTPGEIKLSVSVYGDSAQEIKDRWNSAAEKGLIKKKKKSKIQ